MVPRRWPLIRRRRSQQVVVLLWGSWWCWAHLAPRAEAAGAWNATLPSCPGGCDDPSNPDDTGFDAQYQHVSRLCYASIVGAMTLAVVAGIAAHGFRRIQEVPTPPASQPAKDKLSLETVDTSDDRNIMDDTSTAPSEQDERV